jgi:myo-inositol 2-dehydrogenase / D-chiro-inositol 1-dehydrogenase
MRRPSPRFPARGLWPWPTRWRRRRRRVRDRYGCDIRTIDAIEAAADIDAVVICTPTDTHADLIERFARAGKAVFCEKPVDLSLSRVKDCLKVVEETGAVLMVGFNRRFDPDFRALKAAIDEGRIGRSRW